ncbi:hypothetical protein IT6_02245 [Methylacidiphilum caldifontis]|uniref:hypothetical protein n=1 Tax=Methylacidiphilum caldifontis TaxID=2795386 RepID=UPI001A8CC478|nr:hypothetical protein [Methylacidiphilum caldifontis]QSR89129.1 hypothetical protein IT6_02245 [Methylacidiphilum caldifontis]
MKAEVSILIPFDLGLELEFGGEEANRIVKEISTRTTHLVSFKDKFSAKAQVVTQIYKFGVGLIEVSFPIEAEMAFLTSLAIEVRSINVGSLGILAWVKTFVNSLIEQAKQFASYQYVYRLEELDLFPIFSLEPGIVKDAEAFIEQHYKRLYGIVSGEPNYDSLSPFVLQNEKLINFGYYENELILIKRFGAVVSSYESQVILNIIRLVYALYWNLRSYNFLLDRELDKAQTILAHLPPWYKFWMMPQRYQKFSEEGMNFVQDKLSIVESIYSVFANVNQIASDWHLRTIYKYVEKEFDIDDIASAVKVKLDRVEQSYNSAREFISTNFFIAVEIVLILSLLWMILDTALLYVISQK